MSFPYATDIRISGDTRRAAPADDAVVATQQMTEESCPIWMFGTGVYTDVALLPVGENESFTS